MGEHSISGTGYSVQIKRTDLNLSSITLMCSFYEFQLLFKKENGFSIFSVIQALCVNKQRKGWKMKNSGGNILLKIPHGDQKYSDNVLSNRANFNQEMMLISGCSLDRTVSYS